MEAYRPNDGATETISVHLGEREPRAPSENRQSVVVWYCGCGTHSDAERGEVEEQHQPDLWVEPAELSVSCLYSSR